MAKKIGGSAARMLKRAAAELGAGVSSARHNIGRLASTRRVSRRRALLVTSALGGFPLFPQMAAALDVVVTNTNDSGAGSLRAAIGATNGSADPTNNITFTNNLAGPLTLSSDLSIIKPVSIDFRTSTQVVLRGNAGIGIGTSGVVTLNIVHDYTGNTTLTAGSLMAGGPSHGLNFGLFGSTNSLLAMSPGTTFVVPGNTEVDLQNISGAGTVVNSGGLALFGGTSPATRTFSGTISGSGALTMFGGRETLILSGSTTYAGPTSISGNADFFFAPSPFAELRAGATNAFSPSSDFLLTGNATLNLNNFNQTIGSLTGGSIGGPQPKVLLGSATLTVGGTNSDGTFAGAITGTGGIVKSGTGTFTLNGTNTYSGGTVISAGTLQLGFGGTTGSIVGNVLDNANLAINRSDAFTFGGVISGSGALQQLGAGTTTLTGTNTYTGPTTVTAGTLTISPGGSITSNVTNNATFNNMGIVTGSLINTGTVNNSGTINGGLINSAIVNAKGAINGAVANNANGTFNVAAGVTVHGTFDNAAGATLAIGFPGDTLFMGAASVQGLLTNSGVVTVADMVQFNAAGGITNKAGGTITIGNGAIVRDDLNNAGSVTNNGIYFGNVASNTGLITNTQIWSGNFVSNSGTVANNNGIWQGNLGSNSGTIANNGVWQGNLVSNSGTVVNNGFWQGTVSNAGTFNNPGFVDGFFTNTAGVIVNNGFLTAGARVTGGMLTGSGFVFGDLTVTGGTFLPGDGTPASVMFVRGNLALQSGALYLVQLDPKTSSFAAVGGTASLNGSAGAAFLAGNYVTKRYTILAATGGISGTFSSFDTLGIPSGFKASLSYDAHDVFLNLALNFIPPPGSGLNANQQNAANAIVGFFNTTGGIPLVFGGLTSAGLTQISGEVATGTQQTTFNAMNQFMGVMTDPFIVGRGDPVNAGASAPQFADEADAANAYASNGKPRSKSERDAYAAVYRKAPVMADPFIQHWSVWAAGYGGSQTTDGNAVLGSNNTRTSIGGVAVGADYRFSPYTIAGFALAGGATNFSVNGLGSGRSDLFQAGAFVRHNVGAAYLTGALAYGWQDIATDRTVTIAGTDLLRARFNANAFSGRAEGGYRFVTPWLGGIGVTPYAAGQFVTFDLPAYAEQAIAGANTFALSYASKSVTDTRSELGLRSDKSFAMQNGIFTLRGRAAWAHDFNTDRAITPTFQTLPGASFVVNGAAPAPDAALVTASAEMKWLNGISLAGTFEGEFSNVTTSYAGKAVVRYAW
jgi:autotransporter-associated beta strand protein